MTVHATGLSLTGVSRSPFLAPGIEAYVAAHSSRPDDGLTDRLRERTRAAAGNAAGMQIGDDQAVFLEIVARAMGARRAIEVGTFTGTSALAVARGMGPDGRLLCCDVSEEWTSVARAAWEEAGVAERIELVLAPALDTIRALPAGTVFDLAFVDADKEGYLGYYTELLPRLRPGGLFVADNTLWSGRVLDPGPTDEDTVAIREFNDTVAADDRVRAVLLTLGDGVTVIQKLG